MMDTSTASRIKNALALILILALTIWLSPFIILSLPFLLYFYFKRKKQRHDVVEQIKREWFPRGKFIFFLYSDSKIWKDYFEKEFIPLIEDKAVIWNWSTRYENGWTKGLLEAKIYQLFSGNGVHPMAFLVTPEGKIETFKFHDAYVRFIKSGKPEYKEMEAQFLERVNHWSANQ